uniref:Uncharacterized protein n=1 Tax=Rhizophora mucronata TaxID=61149 RepID=A0A2P2R128_RHIMU
MRVSSLISNEIYRGLWTDKITFDVSFLSLFSFFVLSSSVVSGFSESWVLGSSFQLLTCQQSFCQN